MERCAVLLHLVDGTSDDVVGDWKTIIGELKAYGGALADKPRITALNKIDAMDDDAVAQAAAALETATGGPVLAMSGVSRVGVTEVLRALRAEIDDNRLRTRIAETAPAEPEEVAPWRP